MSVNSWLYASFSFWYPGILLLVWRHLIVVGWCLVDWFVLLSLALTYKKYVTIRFYRNTHSLKSTTVLFIFVICEGDFDQHRCIYCMSILKTTVFSMQYFTFHNRTSISWLLSELKCECVHKTPKALLKHKCKIFVQVVTQFWNKIQIRNDTIVRSDQDIDFIKP